MARYYRPQQNIPAGSYDNTYSKLGTMEERMLVAETMIQAMWTLLKEEGVSIEERAIEYNIF